MVQRVAIVTGGNRGIGFEIARGLARLGLVTFVAARKLADATEACRELGGDGPVRPAQLDVTDDASVARCFGAIARDPGRLDVLVNNAGIAIDTQRPPSEADLEVVRSTFETNFLGAWRAAEAAIPLMRRNGYGRIVNLSSGMGALTEGYGADWPAYRTSKTALNGLTRALAAELEESNILVNAACPGWVQTAMGGPAAPRSPEEGADTPVWLATLPDGSPTGRLYRDRRPAAW